MMQIIKTCMLGEQSKTKLGSAGVPAPQRVCGVLEGLLGGFRAAPTACLDHVLQQTPTAVAPSIGVTRDNECNGFCRQLITARKLITAAFA